MSSVRVRNISDRNEIYLQLESEIYLTEMKYVLMDFSNVTELDSNTTYKVGCNSVVCKTI
jgi:hypothetical protein